MKELSVRCLREDWSDRNVALPSYESAGAAGADLRANFPPSERANGRKLEPLERALIPTGLRVEIPEGFEMQLRPRSGLALKQGLTLLNTPGTIDSDYRGPLGVIAVNLGSDPILISHGDRIAQIVIAPVLQANFEETKAISGSARDAGGFGSTGVG